MKRSALHQLTGLFVILIIVSCKHEIPGSDTEPVPGPLVPPVVTCSPDSVYFQQQVLPVIVSNCAMSGCHDAGSQKDGVVLTDYNNIMNTGEINPGSPGNSELWEKIMDNDPGDRMPPPPMPALSQQHKDIIRKWILQGAKNNSCTGSVCDTSNVSFNGTVKGILTSKCQGCHNSSGPGGGYDLSNYNSLKARVADGKLWGAINHMPGYAAMPKNGSKLSACELSQIKKWIDAGAPDN